MFLEASFIDLRHGGDGNLSRAYVLAKLKASNAKLKIHEQPFPDSWLATAAPLALGILTDIASEIVLRRGKESRDMLWPLIASQYKLWCLGSPPNSANDATEHWEPCEALVRISCREMQRFPLRAAEVLPSLSESEASCWTSSVLQLFSDVLSENVAIEDGTRQQLVKSKHKAVGQRKGKHPSSASLEDFEAVVDTPYGRGRVTKSRTDKYPEAKAEVEMKVVVLDSGATLYRPATESDLSPPITGTQQDEASPVGRVARADGVPFEIDGKFIAWILLLHLHVVCH